MEKQVRIAVAIHVITLLVCYFSWVLDGCDPFIPFISDTDTNPASSWAFTIGFTLTGALMIPLSIQFYNVRRRWAEQNHGSRIETMNLLSAISVAVSGISIIWISYTPWHEQMELHMLQARVIFGGLIIWALLSTVISLRMSERDARFSSLSQTRRSWTVFSLIAFLGWQSRSIRTPGSHSPFLRVTWTQSWSARISAILLCLWPRSLSGRWS